MHVSIVRLDGDLANSLHREVEHVGASSITVRELDEVGLPGDPTDLVLLPVPDDPASARQLIENVRSTTSVRLVAVGRTANPSQIIACVQSGAADYVDRDAPLGPQLAEVLGRSRSEPTGNRLGRLVAVTSSSGGCGRSTVAVNLAVLLATRDRPCGLVDLDLRRGNLGAMLDLKPRHTLAELWADGTRLDTGMVEQSLADHETGVRLLAAPRRIVDLAAGVETIGRTVDLVRGLVPRVVVDVDLETSGTTIPVLAASNPIVFVVQLDFVGVSRARRWLDHLEESGVDRSRILFVVNRHARPGDLPIAKVERVLGGEIGPCLPNDPKTVVRSVNTGRPAVLDAPRSRFATSIAALSHLVAEITESSTDRHAAASVPQGERSRADRPRLFDHLSRAVASITPFTA